MENNIKALEKAIKAKEAEAAKAAQEVQNATEAAQIVAAEKAQRKANAELEALKAAYSAATYTPPELTDKEELLQGLKKYPAEWQARIDKINASMKEAEAEAVQIEAALQQAAADADAKRTITLSNQKEENEAAKRHLAEMLERAQALPVYPAGAIGEEWDAVIKKLLPEWDSRVIALRSIAAAYTAAATEFLEFSETIRSARAEFNKANGGGECCKTAFTVGGSYEGMTVNATLHSQIYAIYNPLLGRAL